MKQSSRETDYYRQAFEMISGSLPNRRWRQILNELQRSGVVINIKSVQNYARFKVQYPRTVLTKSAIKIVEQFQNNYQQIEKIKGEELLKILRNLKPNVGDRMLINAFYKARLSFGKQSVYTYLEASSVVFFTAITKSK